MQLIGAEYKNEDSTAYVTRAKWVWIVSPSLSGSKEVYCQCKNEDTIILSTATLFHKTRWLGVFLRETKLILRIIRGVLVRRERKNVLTENVLANNVAE